MADSELSLREQYLLEKDMIEHEYGGLEGIRLSLGLSQRQLCKVLLVDPSAFTRWNKTGGAPPHIYKALKWLLELKEVQPNAVEPASISRRVDHLQSSTQVKIKQLEEHVESLEKALSLAGNGTVIQSSDSSDLAKEAISYALQQQEKNFEREIESLREEIKASKKTSAKKKTPRKKKKVSKAKKKPVRRKKKTKKKTRKAVRSHNKTKKSSSKKGARGLKKTPRKKKKVSKAKKKPVPRRRK